MDTEYCALTGGDRTPSVSWAGMSPPFPCFRQHVSGKLSCSHFPLSHMLCSRYLVPVVLCVAHVQTWRLEGCRSTRSFCACCSTSVGHSCVLLTPCSRFHSCKRAAHTASPYKCVMELRYAAKLFNTQVQAAFLTKMSQLHTPQNFGPTTVRLSFFIKQWYSAA
jgi:hypothetical protein